MYAEDSMTLTCSVYTHMSSGTQYSSSMTTQKKNSNREMTSLRSNEEFIELFKCSVAKLSKSFIKDSQIPSADVPLKIEEVGDGNLNDVFRIYEEADVTKSAVIKHAPPYIKILGPDFPLTPQRLQIEYKALKWFNYLAPGLVPVPYLWDEKHNIVCMEDLKGYRDLRKELMDGNFHRDVARQLGIFMAAIHSGTHGSNVKIEEMDHLHRDFKNEEMVSLTKQYIFTKPFNPSDETNKCSEKIKHQVSLVYGDPELLSNVEGLKRIFVEKKECLVHGDLHSGSIMVKGPSVKVLDTEFAFVGPGAFDMALLLAHYITSYYCHMSISENNDIHRQFAQDMIEACRLTAETYFQNLDICKGPDRLAHQEKFMAETAGFVGCELLRRIIGVAHVEDYRAPGVSAYAEEDAFHAGIRLVKGYKNIRSIHRLLIVALMLT